MVLDFVDPHVTPLAIVRTTMLLATIAWAIGEILMRRSPACDRMARLVWSVGIALALIHVALAFDVVYDWDHERAVDATARPAADRFGWGWRGSIYVNYAFLILWFVDVCWWWTAPGSHAARSRRTESLRLAVFTFMFFNGAIVFASAGGRIVGIAAVAAVLFASPVLHRRAVPA